MGDVATSVAFKSSISVIGAFHNNPRNINERDKGQGR